MMFVWKMLMLQVNNLKSGCSVPAGSLVESTWTGASELDYRTLVLGLTTVQTASGLAFLVLPQHLWRHFFRRTNDRDLFKP